MSFGGYLLAMAVTTYLIRMLPLTLFRRPIRSRFIRSFLAYVPCACLSAMTFPAILTATDSPIAGLAGLIVAVFLAFQKKGLVTVAAGCCIAVFLCGELSVWLG